MRRPTLLLALFCFVAVRAELVTIESDRNPFNVPQPCDNEAGRPKTNDAGDCWPLRYQGETWERFAQVARQASDMYEMIFRKEGKNANVKNLFEILAGNVAAHPKIYGACLAFKEGWYNKVYDEPCPTEEDPDATCWNGKQIYAPYLYKSKEAPRYKDPNALPSNFTGEQYNGVAGSNGWSMDLIIAYDYTDAEAAGDWYTTPAALWEVYGSRMGWWTEPYFDSGAGNIWMVTYSAPIIIRLGDDVVEEDCQEWGRTWVVDQTDDTAQCLDFVGIVTIDVENTETTSPDTTFARGDISPAEEAQRAEGVHVKKPDGSETGFVEPAMPSSCKQGDTVTFVIQSVTSSADIYRNLFAWEGGLYKRKKAANLIDDLESAGGDSFDIEFTPPKEQTDEVALQPFYRDKLDGTYPVTFTCPSPAKPGAWDLHIKTSNNAVGSKYLEGDLTFPHRKGSPYTIDVKLYPNKFNLHMLPEATKTFATALFAVNIILSVSFGIWTILNKNTQVVKAAQPPFLLTICLGCIVSTSTIIPLSWDSQGGLHDPVTGQALACPENVTAVIPDVYRFCPESTIPSDGIGGVCDFEDAVDLRCVDFATSDLGCRMYPWLYSLGFIITFSSLFGKTWRINKIMLNKSVARIVVPPSTIFTILLAILSVDSIFLGIWTASDPLKWKRTDLLLQQGADDRVWTSDGECKMEGSYYTYLSPIMLLHIALLIYGNLLLYRARNFNGMFQEAKYIAFCMVSSLQVFALGIPLVLAVSGDVSTRFFVFSAIIFLNDFTVLIFIFVPKILVVVGITPMADLASTATQGATKLTSNTAAGSANSNALAEELISAKRQIGALQERLAEQNQKLAEQNSKVAVSG